MSRQNNQWLEDETSEIILSEEEEKAMKKNYQSLKSFGTPTYAEGHSRRRGEKVTGRKFEEIMAGFS